jgi:hypothetical protein
VQELRAVTLPPHCRPQHNRFMLDSRKKAPSIDDLALKYEADELGVATEIDARAEAVIERVEPKVEEPETYGLSDAELYSLSKFGVELGKRKDAKWEEAEEEEEEEEYSDTETYDPPDAPAVDMA